MSMKQILEQCRVALSSDKKQSAAQWRELRNKLSIELAAMERRLPEIAEGSLPRQHLALKGDVEGLRAMADELADLQVRLEVARPVMTAVQAATSRAEAREAIEALPGVYSTELVECIEAEEAAIEAWRAAQAATALTLNKIKTLRMSCGRSAPSADEATLERLLRARNVTGGHEATNLAGILGIDFGEYRRSA